MRDFVFHIHDDRYSVPTLAIVTAASEARARELALSQLEESHHTAVEVYEADRQLFRVER